MHKLSGKDQRLPDLHEAPGVEAEPVGREDPEKRSVEMLFCRERMSQEVFLPLHYYWIVCNEELNRTKIFLINFVLVSQLNLFG